MTDGTGLVADIGREAVRFGLTGGPGQGLTPREVRRYTLAEHASFTAAVLTYVSSVGLDGQSLPSSLAVAGAVRGDLINVTGSRWFVSLSGMEAVLRFRPRAMNECAASALALSTLPSSAFRHLVGRLDPPAPGGNYLIVAPGAGLGVSVLITHGGRLIAMQSEAGHQSYNPCTVEERQLADRLARRGVTPSLESVLATRGLVAIHESLGGKAGPAVTAEALLQPGNRDPLVSQAIEIYSGALGAALGDWTLAFGAWDGVFLTGPFARAMVPRLTLAALTARMQGKDAFRRQLAQVPISIVSEDGLELMGAAVALAA